MEVTKGITTKGTRKVLYTTIAFFAIIVMAITAVAIYVANNRRIVTPKDPLAWSVDTWEGEVMNGAGFVSNYADRGSNTIR